MAMGEAELFAEGVSLPPAARRLLAIRLLESVQGESTPDQELDSWLRSEVASAYDALLADPDRAISNADVRAEFEQREIALDVHLDVGPLNLHRWPRSFRYPARFAHDNFSEANRGCLRSDGFC